MFFGQHLGCAQGHYPRQGPAGKGDHQLARPGRGDDRPGFQPVETSGAGQGQALAFDAPHQRLQPQLDGQAGQLLQKRPALALSSRYGRRLSTFEILPTGPGVFIQQRHRHTGLSRSDGRSQSGRAGADDGQLSRGHSSWPRPTGLAYRAGPG